MNNVQEEVFFISRQVLLCLFTVSWSGDGPAPGRLKDEHHPAEPQGGRD
nr:hypothetical protein [Alkalicoccus halolimnae]